MFLSNLSIVHVPLLLPLSSGITVSMPSSAYSDKNAINQRIHCASSYEINSNLIFAAI